MLRTMILALLLLAPGLAIGAEVRITIADSTAGEMMAQAYKQNVGAKHESDSGYEKVEKVGDLIVRESFKNAEQKGSLTALVNERATVEVNTKGLPASVLREWLDRVNTGIIAAAQPDGESKVIPQGELAKALPEPPEGWKAGRAEEVTSSSMGFTLSQATRTYEKK
jgi:hypothetical protein